MKNKTIACITSSHQPLNMSDFFKFVNPSCSEQFEAELVEAASDCLDRFTSFFNACDPSGMDSELHFPHFMLSGAECVVWAAPGQHPDDFFEKLRASGWDQTRYEAKDTILVSQNKVHFVVTYTRRNQAGDVLSTHKNLWIVTRISGKWGITLRSY